MKSEDRRRGFPQKPANRAENDAFLFACVCYSDLRSVEERLEKRLRMIPGGWRKMRTINGMLDSVLLDLKATWDADKWRQIQRTSARMKHKLIVGPQVVKDEEEYVLGERDMGVLVDAASGKCQLCMGEPGACRRCELGRTLDTVSFISRQGRAWWEVFERAERVDVGEEPGYMEG